MKDNADFLSKECCLADGCTFIGIQAVDGHLFCVRHAKIEKQKLRNMQITKGEGK